ncbi:type IV secretion system protein [Erythrobacter sp. SDW2]|uniref:type IV secretion system protein n=1 Tax=Erythrobacter sp. SDW2 TaxID=2907154 RepID=UPI001F2985D2|nr:type IV secretion system protein [Erythrobacter sp. SDW2]UIP06224.1 type IV secretion system protein [Erythrobacter sp. SDW2]
MSAQCDAAMSEAAGGIATALKAVDCVSAEMTGSAFGKLFAPGGQMATVLTILLTLYVIFFAMALMTGRSNLSVRAMLPRIILVGLVLTFSTSWAAYQSIVWNLALGAPDWLAGILTGDRGSATMTFAAKVDIVFQAVEQASAGQTDIEAFSPPGMLRLGALLFMLGTVGVLVTARIALAVLIALGPVFIVMVLFNGTRGMFTGWLKGVVMLALTPLFAVLAGGIMLELSVPILSALTQTSGEIPARPAMAFLMVGAVHVALMVMVLKVAGTMVAGWKVFGLANEQADRDEVPVTASPPAATVRSEQGVAAQAPAAASGTSARRTAVAAAMPYIAANDTGGGASSTRETRIVGTASANGQPVTANAATSRTRGIGNRFKAAPPPSLARSLARSTENVK